MNRTERVIRSLRLVSRTMVYEICKIWRPSLMRVFVPLYWRKLRISRCRCFWSIWEKRCMGSEPIYLNRTGPAAMTTPMSGRPMVWNRKRRTFKMCPQRCAQAGIGILVSAGILSLRTWKISERRILFNMKTSNDRGFIRLWWFPCMTTKRLLDFMAWIILR